jgi:hypothetical protein
VAPTAGRGIVILSTAHGLLGHAEQVQAAHATAAAQPDPEEEALAVGEGSDT